MGFCVTTAGNSRKVMELLAASPLRFNASSKTGRQARAYLGGIRMKSIRVQCVVLASLALVFAASVVAASDDELARSAGEAAADSGRDRSRRQPHHHHAARDAVLRDRIPEKKVMEEMSGTLAGLSKNQMEQVIRQLEAAAVAKTEKQSDEAYEKAYANHRQVLDALHEMVARHDAIKSLEQAADRFEQHAKKEFELHVQSGQSIRDLIESSKPDLSPTLRLLLAKRMKAHGTEMKRQSDTQDDVARDVRILIKQVKDLPSLSAEHQGARQGDGEAHRPRRASMRT